MWYRCVTRTILVTSGAEAVLGVGQNMEWQNGSCAKALDWLHQGDGNGKGGKVGWVGTGKLLQSIVLNPQAADDVGLLS